MPAPTIATQNNSTETQMRDDISAIRGESDDDLVPDDSNPQEPGAVGDKTQTRTERRQKDLLEMREERSTKQRRKIRRVSRLARYRADIVVLRKIGATYAEIALWLKKKKKITVATSTVLRYVTGLPEFQRKDAEDDG
jgi:hypothetical protein